LLLVSRIEDHCKSEPKARRKAREVVYLICDAPVLGVGAMGWVVRKENTLSRDARQGWACSGYEKSISTTMAALPNVAAAEFSYIEMMFPETLEPEIRNGMWESNHMTCTP
jgi:hypothetical protein